MRRAPGSSARAAICLGENMTTASYRDRNSEMPDGHRPEMRALELLVAKRLAAREDPQEEQVHVQDVEEDRRGQQRRHPDVPGVADALEVDHREAGEDDQ